MSIDSRHPLFVEREDDWRLMRDTFAGERKIKEAGMLYLPATSGQIEDGALKDTTSVGFNAYQAYKKRAIFPDVVREAVSTLVGVMHREAPHIELPPELEPLRARATRKSGETLAMLLRRINEQQMLYGRFGLLADVARGAEAPHLVTYGATEIINWDDDRIEEFDRDMLQFLVVNEDTFVRGREGQSIFDWEVERRFRVAELNPETGLYQTFVEVDEARSEVVVPVFRGRTLNEIPFVMIGSNDLCFDPDDIPLLGLANLAIAIYRGEADYRQALFMQGQDTLVVEGEEAADDDSLDPSEKPTRIGAGAKINVPMGGDAKFIGVDGEGLPEMRRALDELHRRAQQGGARLLEPRGAQAESGEALKVRVAASTSTLHQIALTGAAGLESILKTCARWVGANEDAVRVVPNLDFTESVGEPKELGDFMESKAKGAPISLKSIHEWARENELTKRTYEDELRLIAQEEVLLQRMRESLTSTDEPEPPEPDMESSEDDEDAESTPDEE